jgi:protein-tyrosine phosphatase
MLDLHCHILPGIDDGAASLAEALAMARFSVQDGITHVVATPHCHSRCHLLRNDVLPHVTRFQDALAEAEIPLTVLPGSEIQVVHPAEYRREFEAGRFCHLGDSRRFTLLEFSWQERKFPADAAELIAWIRDQGLTPIVAHPERYRLLTEEPDRLAALVEAGAWLQVTVDSLLGNHGPRPQSAGEELLRTYPLAVLATDAHNLSRCSGLSVGYAWVREQLGRAREAELRSRAAEVLAAIQSR